jgi:hypothetical protein
MENASHIVSLYKSRAVTDDTSGKFLPCYIVTCFGQQEFLLEILHRAKAYSGRIGLR